MPARLIACLIVLTVVLSGFTAALSQEGLPPLPAPVAEDEEVEAREAAPPPPPSMPQMPAPPAGPDRPKRDSPQPPKEPTIPTEREAPAPPTEKVLTTPTSPGRDWTMYKYDPAHTGYTVERLSFPLKLAWKHVTDMSADNPSSPAVKDGVVYFCSGRRLYAVNADTGSLRWRYPASESLTASIRSSPLVGDGLVYFGAGDGRLYAVTTEEGSLAWSLGTRRSISSSPVLVDGVIYVGSDSEELYALDARTGTMKWPGAFRTKDDIASSPAVADGLVYFFSSDTILYAAHTASGRIKWVKRVGTGSRHATPVVAENVVYLGAGNALYAFQAKSGRLKWAIPLSSDITTTPSAALGAVFFACKNGKLYALTNAGKLKWKAPVDIGAPAYGSPVIAGDTVIVTANKGIILAADVETGVVKWKYVAEPSALKGGKLKYVNLAAAPVVSNGTLYVLADDGALLAFRPDIPDSTPPQIVTVRPTRDFLTPGTPPIEISAIVKDTGSGIKYDTVTLTLDDEPVEHNVIPERGIIWYKTPRTQPVTNLPDGRHTASLLLTDWAGNKTYTEWSFVVDNRLRFPPKPTPAADKARSAPGVPAPPPVMHR